MGWSNVEYYLTFSAVQAECGQEDFFLSTGDVRVLKTSHCPRTGFISGAGSCKRIQDRKRSVDFGTTMVPLVQRASTKTS